MNPRLELSSGGLWARWREGWDRFWFTPADPTMLGLIRICCGLITLYTILAYSFALQQFMGPYGWVDLQHRLDEVHNKAVAVTPLNWEDRAGHRRPQNDQEREFARQYFEKFSDYPPWPHPKNQAEADWCDEFRFKSRQDVRRFNLPIPQDKLEIAYVLDFFDEFGQPPAPPYPRHADGTWNKELDQEIREYFHRYGQDPRLLYSRGTPVWSIWFHVTEPGWMMVVHLAMVLVTLLFVLGFATRVTSVLTWLGALSYIHRNPNILFGVDTMMNILLIYLMIGPSGAALSVDRWLAKWWSTARPRVLARWRSLWGLPAGDPAGAPMPPARPEPSVSANVALRLLQIHVCIIYGMAGFSKLLGQAWWRGDAVWSTISNFEFAPMQYELYNICLRFLGSHRLVFETFLTGAVYFTLFFEISYPYLIWLPSTRWLLLAMAITLHGFIGLFMGLKTFSLMMLVMNMAFLRPNEVHWLLSWFTASKKSAPTPLPESVPLAAPATAIRGDAKETVRPTAVKRKK